MLVTLFSYRSINGGVVLILPNGGKIVNILCNRTDGRKRYELQTAKNVVSTDKPFYETHQNDDGSILLKIENLDEGDWKVDVTMQTLKKSFEVEVKGNITFHFLAHFKFVIKS